ncbi:MAG: hypothetical protein ACYSTG_06040 [Planctomycetota bacterium]|jgi:hypothetical protein
MKPEENIRRLVEESDVTTNSQVDRRILGDALDDLEKFKREKLAGARPNVWRTIMKSRITKLAAAAAIIIAVLIGIYKSGGSIDGAGVVWAEVANKIEQMPTCIHREKRIITCDGKEVDFLTGDVTKYVSPEYGLREDMYNQWGQIMHRLYILREERVAVTAIPQLKQYKVAQLTEAQVSVFGMGQKQILEQIKSGQYTELGSKTIDGVEVEGIEFSDLLLIVGTGYPIKFDNVVMRFWVDVETSLPVRVDVEAVTSDKYITVWTGGKPVEIEAVADGYQWYVDIDQSVFEPNIPDDYTLISEEMDSYDEEKAINGLLTFAWLTYGEYPSRLNMMTISREACPFIQEHTSTESDEEPVKKEDKIKEIIVATKSTCLFFNRLVKEDKDVAYYGDTVTAGDVNAVLVRWKISDNEYRVVFGDLTAKNVSAEDLAKLESLPLE